MQTSRGPACACTIQKHTDINSKIFKTHAHSYMYIQRHGAQSVHTHPRTQTQSYTVLTKHAPKHSHTVHTRSLISPERPTCNAITLKVNFCTFAPIIPITEVIQNDG